MSAFNLRERAEELFPRGHAVPRRFAIQLATEALEAAAKKCADHGRQAFGGNDYSDGWNAGMHDCCEIIRSFIAKPGAQEERAPRVQSSPDASHGERVSADAPPAPSVLDDAKRALFAKPGANPTSGDSARRPVTTGRPPAPLSDAEILSMAAEIVAPYDDAAEQHSNVSGALLELAAKLRAAEEVGVFEAFADWWCGAEREGSWTEMREMLSEYFCPLVTALENIRDAHGQDEWNKAMARDALLALRERAREAGGGR